MEPFVWVPPEVWYKSWLFCLLVRWFSPSKSCHTPICLTPSCDGEDYMRLEMLQVNQIIVREIASVQCPFLRQSLYQQFESNLIYEICRSLWLVECPLQRLLHCPSKWDMLAFVILGYRGFTDSFEVAMYNVLEMKVMKTISNPFNLPCKYMNSSSIRSIAWLSSLWIKRRH